MFMQEKEVVLKGLIEIGDRLCVYRGQPWLTRHCDCKYGIGDGGHETTGCPELREAYALIDALTPFEFTRLVNRSGGIITARLFGWTK